MRQKRAKIVVSAAVGLGLWCPVNPTRAAVYQAEVIAHDWTTLTPDGRVYGQFGDMLLGNGYAPAINDAGQIAFVGWNRSGTYNIAIQRYDGVDGFTALESTTDGHTSSWAGLDLNADGTVAWINSFYRPYSVAGTDFTAAGFEVQTANAPGQTGPGTRFYSSNYYDSAGNRYTGTLSSGIAVNAAGDVAYVATDASGSRTVFRNQTARVTHGQSIGGHTLTGISQSRPDLNDAGTLAFTAGYGVPGQRGLFTLAADDTVQFIDAHVDTHSSEADPFALNNHNELIYIQGDDGDASLRTYRDGSVTELINTETSVIDSFDGVAFNDRGGYAFLGTTDNGQRGVFTSADIEFGKVIAEGDTVTLPFYDENGSISSYTAEYGILSIEGLSRSGINNHGDLAVLVTLDTGFDTRAVLRFRNATPADAVTTGTQTVSVAGDGGHGAVTAEFDNVTQAGRLTVDHRVLDIQGFDDSKNYGNYEFLVNVLGPFDSLQVWQLEFDGEFEGEAKVTFTYDDTLIPTGYREDQLGLWHLPDGATVWERVAVTIDVDANTISGWVDSFSPFVLGPVPEPATAALLGLGGVTLLTRRRA